MTGNQSDYERLAWISARYHNTYRHDATYPTAREILITIADWMDHEARPGSTITADTLRAIANAKPDPLDALSPEDRAGYHACKAYHSHRREHTGFADEVYITGLPALASFRESWNAAAAAAIAEYERQKAGAK